MSRLAAIGLAMCLCSSGAFGQDLESLQIHGFVTQ